MISVNLPGRMGLSADAGAGTDFEWTPGGGEPGAERHEAGEIHMFNHWATGLRSGLLPEGCEVATQQLLKNGPIVGEVFARVLIFRAREHIFGGFW